MGGRGLSRRLSIITNNQFIDAMRAKGLTRTYPSQELMHVKRMIKITINWEGKNKLNISQIDKIINESVIGKYGDESGTKV